MNVDKEGREMGEELGENKRGGREKDLWIGEGEEREARKERGEDKGV